LVFEGNRTVIAHKNYKVIDGVWRKRKVSYSWVIKYI
jgi:hypothetical protein